MRRWFLLIIFIYSVNSFAACSGRFLNPITDVCWSCLFPISIGSAKLNSSGLPDTDNPSTIPCLCPREPLPVPVPGIPIGFWEPVRLVDVVREPFCMVNLGGVKFGSNYSMYGSHGSYGNDKYGQENSFYHVHWYIYPLIYWLEILTDFICLEKGSFDVAWLSEFDPSWNDDEMNFILNPEAALFANPLAQSACAADCIASTIKPLDSMFWCVGCQGSMYPFAGTIPNHVGGVASSLLATTRLMAKMHRVFLLWGTSGKQALCKKYPMPIIKKTQYRLQMVYPRAATNKALGCHPIGRSSILLEAGREFPVKGEDFGYLIWRKRNCCVL